MGFSFRRGLIASTALPERPSAAHEAQAAATQKAARVLVVEVNNAAKSGVKRSSVKDVG
jgi:hypothetical protein